jgi:hypothetical protein
MSSNFEFLVVEVGRRWKWKMRRIKYHMEV